MPTVTRVDWEQVIRAWQRDRGPTMREYHRAMTDLGIAAQALPHRAEWRDGEGWRCVLCGGESMDLGVLAGVPCDRLG